MYRTLHTAVRVARDIIKDRETRKEFKLDALRWVRTCEDGQGNVYGVQHKGETLLGTMHPKSDSKPLVNLNDKDEKK